MNVRLLNVKYTGAASSPEPVFVVMRELRLRQALTTDRHFSEAGFETLLPVV